MNSLEHTARRPDWNCLTCGAPWPCDRAVADLRHAYDPDALRALAAAYRAEAAQYLTGLSPDELDQRFLRAFR